MEEILSGEVTANSWGQYVFVTLESRLSFEYLVYHRLEPFPSTPQLARVLMLMPIH